jgi:hypothetical protein
LKSDRPTDATHGFKEIEVKGVFQIFPWLDTGFSASTTKIPEEVTKQIFKPKRRTVPTVAERESPTATPLFVGAHFLGIEPRLKPLFAKLVIEFASLLVAQHIVRKRDFLEPLFSFFIARIDVRVILTSKFPVGFFDILSGRSAADPKRCIEVFLCHLFYLFAWGYPYFPSSDLTQRSDNFPILRTYQGTSAFQKLLGTLRSSDD